MYTIKLQLYDFIYFRNNVTTILFIPYALKDYDDYYSTVNKVLINWGYKVTSIHKSNPTEALTSAEAIFIGGGNTFQLLKTLYDNGLVELIRKRVLNDGIPYLGSSAGDK